MGLSAICSGPAACRDLEESLACLCALACRDCVLFRLVAEDDPWAEDPEFLAEVVVSRYERQRSQTEVVNAMPLYPTEAILWDDNQVPQVHYTGARCSLLLTLQLLLQLSYS